MASEIDIIRVRLHVRNIREVQSIDAIRFVRDAAGLRLIEAKRIVEGALAGVDFFTSFEILRGDLGGLIWRMEERGFWIETLDPLE